MMVAGEDGGRLPILVVSRIVDVENKHGLGAAIDHRRMCVPTLFVIVITLCSNKNLLREGRTKKNEDCPDPSRVNFFFTF